MNYTDFDLDIYNTIKDLPEPNAVLYFRSNAPGEWEDFFFARGGLDEMAETLAGLMSQNDDLEYLIVRALEIFTE